MKKIKLFIASFIGAIALVFACIFGGVKAEPTSYYSVELKASDLVVTSGQVTGGFNTTVFGFDTNKKWSYDSSSESLMSTHNTSCVVTLKKTGNITVNYRTTSNKKTIKVGENSTSGYIASSGTGSFIVDNVAANTTITFVNASGFTSIVYTTTSSVEGLMASSTTLTFDAQYNEEEASDSNKLRFIGTIDGVAYGDYTNIKSMEFNFSFNETERTVIVNKLYKSIVSGENIVKAVADDTMYVVFQLNNINKTAYQNKSLSNCRFVVTFTDDSAAIVNRDDIVLPSTFTTVVA
ncbi:MAG: hypothetical protein IKP77_04495 [Acholeplasmatales bacterium]|nr:hypothetical protein [Acholeplasmatales bacterium]